MKSESSVDRVQFRNKGKKTSRSAIGILACLLSVAPWAIPMPSSAQGSSDGPLLIINQDSGGPAAGQNLPQQIIVPKIGPSFGDPSSISNGAFLASASPYRWLGAYNGVPCGSVAPVFGVNPYMPVATGFSAFGGGGYLPYGGFGHSFGNFGPAGFGGYGGYGHFGALSAMTGLGGGYGGFGGLGNFGGLGGYGGFGGFGSPIGYAGLGGLGMGLGMGAISGLGGGFGGLGGYGGYGHLGGFGGYGGYGGFVPMAGMGFGGLGMAGMGMAGMGMGGTSPEFGRLTNTRVIQTAPSKASGNYYAPSTPDPTASGSYYANSSGSSTSLVFPASHQSGSQSYTKPQRDYWGSGGNPFNKDLNSVPWSK